MQDIYTVPSNSTLQVYAQGLYTQQKQRHIYNKKQYYW